MTGLIKRLTKRGRRGFNLIEVTIVVVVLGLLGSAVLVPISASLLNEQYEREAIAIERIKRAIIGYAARRGTPGVRVRVDTSNNPIDVFHVPAGRPYLPCPDIDGDGHEDRNHYNLAFGSLFSPAPGILPIAIQDAEGVVILQSFDEGATSNNAGDLKTAGACKVMRGLLPWRTLGVPPLDVWGNLYTYAVDAAYSHSLVGFNKNTIADNFSAHGLMEVNGGNLTFRRRGIITGDLGGSETTNYNLPIGLCLGVAALCDSSAANLANLTLAYGSKITTATPATTPVANRIYQANDLQDGLVFVVLSHGRNGWGAARVNAAGAISCNNSITNVANHENANYPFVENPYGNVINNANCVSQAINGRNANFFTILRRNDINPDTAFDDIMAWMTREELNDIITRDAPDLPLFAPRCANHTNTPATAC